MQLKVWENYSKRQNSTARPTGGTTVECTLKQATSVTTPTFILTVQNFNITYMQWDNRYYFVTDIRSVRNGVIEVSGQIDVLATYKSYILNTSAYVVYSSSRFNTDMLDTRISNTGIATQQSVSTTPGTGVLNENGCYCMSIIGSNGDLSNIIFMDRENLGKISTSVSELSDEDITNSLVLKFGSVFGAITGCTFIPFSLPSGTTTINVKLGTFQTTAQGYITSNLTRTVTSVINIPWINSDKARRHTERVSLYLPMIGEVPIDTSQIMNESILTIESFYDYVTGEVTYLVHNSESRLKYSAQLGIPVQFAYTSQSKSSSIMSTAFESLSKMIESLPEHPLGLEGVSALSTVFSKQAQTLLSAGVNYNTIGSNGGYGCVKAALSQGISIVNTCYDFSETQANMATVLGRPLGKVVSLSSLTGYCQCNGASVVVPCEESERDKINTFVNNGFYIE